MIQRTLYIDQVFALRHNLTQSEAAVFWFFTRLSNWAESIVIGGRIYYFAAKPMACSNLPIVTTKVDTMYRIYRSLEKKGLVMLEKHGTKDLVHVVSEYAKQWNNANYRENSDLNPTKLGIKSETGRNQIRVGSDLNPTYKEEYHKEEYKEEEGTVSGIVVNHDGGAGQSSLFDDSDATASPGKRKNSAKKKSAVDRNAEADEVLIFLNTIAGRDFARQDMPGGKKNRAGIISLLKRKYTVDHLKDMVTMKVFEWNDKPKSRVWVRPSTLFGSKAEGYLDAARMAKDDPKFAQIFIDAKAAEASGGGYVPDTESAQQFDTLANF